VKSKKTYMNWMVKRFAHYKDKNYDCVILKRYRESDDRITTYYLIPELAYMFYRVIDESPEEYQKLELKELLSFG
jgi:hypothetical protein